MTADNDRLVTALRSSLKETERLREENRRLSEVSAEPIAIVGIGCRYPGGVASPDDLWTLLTAETDAIGEFPTDRGWDLDTLFDPDPEHAHTTYTR
ncbi:beta-ketoacyl synthase-like protein, partial [Murinocardiopsis flavida]